MFDTAPLDGFNGVASQPLVASLRCLFKFSVAQVLVRLQEKFTNNFVFHTRAWAADFNNRGIYTTQGIYTLAYIYKLLSVFIP